MIGIIVNDELLELYGKTRLELTLRNPAFVGGDIDKIAGSYSLPITIPLTPKNTRLLNFPNVVENTAGLVTDVPCQLMYAGLTIFNGLLSVRSAEQGKAKLYIVFDASIELKNTRLTDLPLDVLSFNTIAEALSAAKASASAPLSYNYAFFPVLNEDYFSAEDLPEIEQGGDAWPRRYQNYYDVDTQQFISSEYQRSAMPFVRLDHIIEKIATATNNAITNNWQTTDELKALYCYNNTNLYAPGSTSWALDWELANHVPDISSAEYLKRLSRLFCLGLFYDRFKREYELTPLSEIITRNYKHDWTNKAAPEYSVSQNKDYPAAFRFKAGADGLHSINVFDPPAAFTEIESYLDFYGPSPLAYGWYYSKDVNSFLFSPEIPNIRLAKVKKMFRELRLETTGDEYEFKTGPLFMNQSFEEDQFGLFHQIQPLRAAPQISLQGGKTEDLRLILYRGMHANYDAKLYPFATNNIYDPTETIIPTADVSLLWNGDKGLYNKYWLRWVEFLKAKKDVERVINLSLIDILNFSFKDKVLIENNQYFVKELKIVLAPEGIIPARAKLASVI